MEEYSQNLTKEDSTKPDRIIDGRDMRIYRRELDASTNDKYATLAPYIGKLPEGAVIVDVGSGTGALTEKMALEYRGAKVYAVDISHELLEMAGEKPLIHLIYDDARTLTKIPDNSVDLIYSHT